MTRVTTWNPETATPISPPNPSARPASSPFRQVAHRRRGYKIGTGHLHARNCLEFRDPGFGFLHVGPVVMILLIRMIRRIGPIRAIRPIAGSPAIPGSRCTLRTASRTERLCSRCGGPSAFRRAGRWAKPTPVLADAVVAAAAPRCFVARSAPPAPSGAPCESACPGSDRKT